MDLGAIHNQNHMRAKRSIERKARQHSPGTADGDWGAETAVFGMLGLTAMVAIVLALVSSSMPSRPTQLSAAGEKTSIARYLGSGQLVADARTLVSIAHYIMEPEEPTRSNRSEAGRKGTNLTNTASAAPKA